MTTKIVEVTNPYQFNNDSIERWSQLWTRDFDDAGIESCFLAVVDGEIVGFQTINIDNQTIAIEVMDDYQGNGIAFKLISESGSSQPEYDSNPEFWSKVTKAFGNEDEDK